MAPARDRRWVLGGGLQWRRIGRIDFDTEVTALALPGLFGGNVFTPPSGIGADSGYESRTYDDGFVSPDGRTPNVGRTTDYGYRNGGQLKDDSLVYTARGGERREVTTLSSSAATDWHEDRDWEVSPYLRFSRLTDLGNGWSSGPAFQCSFTGIDGGRRGLGTLLGREQLDVFEVTATDIYDTTGLLMPQAPYTGGPNLVAPLLPAVPGSRNFSESLESVEVAVWNDSIAQSLDLDLWAFSFGGEMVYQDGGKFVAALGGGVVGTIANWDAKRSDVLQ
ncbi:MAG: hypothetical protein O3A92_06345 [Verrucomicrobia bacterium]|nr:hypothetical protein [Verrucomicrobiota bacterium]